MQRTFIGDSPDFRADLRLEARHHAVFSRAVGHAADADEHEARGHDEDGRDGNDGPCPAAEEDGED